MPRHSSFLYIHHGCQQMMQWNAVSLTYRGIFLTAGMEKGIKYNQDHPSIVLHFERHNFRHNAVVLRVMLKSIMLKFFSIMYLTLFATQTFNGGYKRKKKPLLKVCVANRNIGQYNSPLYFCSLSLFFLSLLVP